MSLSPDELVDRIMDVIEERAGSEINARLMSEDMIRVVLQAIKDGEVCTTTENIKGALRYQEVVLRPEYAKMLEVKVI